MYEPDDELYFFAHLLDAEFPRSCAMVALDMKNGLSTVVKGTTGTPFRNNGNASDLLLRRVTRWKAGRQHRPICGTAGRMRWWATASLGIHRRGNPGLTIDALLCDAFDLFVDHFPAGRIGWHAVELAGLVPKLRDGVYIMAWVEEACNGTLGVICFNERIMHDAGFGFPCRPQRPEPQRHRRARAARGQVRREAVSRSEGDLRRASHDGREKDEHAAGVLPQWRRGARGWGCGDGGCGGTCRRRWRRRRRAERQACGVGAAGSAEDREAIRQPASRHSWRGSSNRRGCAGICSGRRAKNSSGAYRQSRPQLNDEVRLQRRRPARFRRRSTARWSSAPPLQDDCTAAQMARLQRP